MCAYILVICVSIVEYASLYLLVFHTTLGIVFCLY